MASIRKRGDKWQVQIRRKGLRSVSRSFHQKDDAQRWARQLEAMADRGELTHPDSVRYHHATVADLLVRYRDEVVTKKRSQAVESYIVNALLRQGFCSMHLSALSPAPFARYRDRRLTKVQPVTVRRELGILQHAFTIAKREWGWAVPKNPIMGLQKPFCGQHRKRRVSAGEEMMLLEECAACRNPWILPCVKLALETAMRRGELLQLHWADLDLKSRTIHIAQTKNGYPRTIPITSKALDVLTALPRSFDGRVLPVTAEALKQAWKRAVRRAGIDDLRFHDLRHEAITRFFEMGLSVPEVALISGHRDYRVLAMYTHLRAEDLAQKLF